MKIKVFSELLGAILALSCCGDLSNQIRVVKIKDLRRTEEAVWRLDYDDKGRLSTYGKTPIEYKEDEIRIGRMDWDYRGEQLLSVNYFFSNDEVLRSEARCFWITDSTEFEVKKEVDYLLCGDTINMEITYFSVPEHRFLKQIYAQYVYNDEGNLAEVISRYINANRQESNCHSYYNYDLNISYESNLNMQSFFIDAEGPDIFFFLLLDMDGKFKEQKLPTRIQYCVNHGKTLYMADGLYRMENESLVRGEVVSDDVKLKVRVEFEYAD